MTEILRRYSLSIALLVVLAAAWYSRAPATQELYEFAGTTMGTTYSVKIVELPTALPVEEFIQSIHVLLTRLDREQMSTYVPNSELSRLNTSPVNTELPLSREMAEVLRLAVEMSELTGGAFDVTVGPLVNRWGFGPEARSTTRIPTQDEIQALLARVGYRNLQLQDATLIKTADVYLDLSGIAKGYAVDQLAEYFDSLEIASYFIEVGGELRIKGYKPGNESWVPAIEKPVDTVPQIHNIFYANGESIAVAGSGDYRNYFEEDGVHYSHEIDPVTGKPVTHNLAGVYVIDHSAARADALATAFMVMGADKGFELAQRMNLAAYFITKRAGSDGFDDRYTDRFTHYLQEQ
ncbi:MAG: FAD:protein FMN transferase [Gammaproteobacteria bacterium]|nr:FAD:protein FMN transferase [Gammaproteobacteria bacterium]